MNDYNYHDEDMTNILTEAEILALVEMADEVFDTDLQELAELEFVSEYGFDEDGEEN